MKIFQLGIFLRIMMIIEREDGTLPNILDLSKDVFNMGIIGKR
jgi:hypothetical protein